MAVVDTVKLIAIGLGRGSMKQLFGMIVSLPVVYGMLLITASIWCMPDSAQAVQFTLTVSKAGTGSGTVTSSPTGITCGSTCSAPFNSNTSVTLTAVAASDSTFDSWRGAGCSGTGSCTVSITQAPNVTATFTLRSVPNLPPIADAGPDQTVIEGAFDVVEKRPLVVGGEKGVSDEINQPLLIVRERCQQGAHAIHGARFRVSERRR